MSNVLFAVISAPFYSLVYSAGAPEIVSSAHFIWETFTVIGMNNCDVAYVNSADGEVEAITQDTFSRYYLCIFRCY